jgi:hypothetical protein
MAYNYSEIKSRIIDLRNEFHTLTMKDPDLWTWKHVEYYLNELAILISELDTQVSNTIPSPGLFSQITNGPLITYASGQTSVISSGVGTLSVPANGFKVGDSFKLVIHGDMTSGNNSNLRIRLNNNGVPIEDITITLISTTNEHFNLETTFVVRAIGQAGTAKLLSTGFFAYTKTANQESRSIHFDTLDSTNFNTTINSQLDITFQWLTNNSTNSVFVQSLNLYKIF